MSYAQVADMAADKDLLARLAACAAVEGHPTPAYWVQQNVWHLVASPGWGDAYTYAVTTGVARPGRDEAVITDAAILAAVQPLIGD